MTQSTLPATDGSAPGSPMAKVLRGRNFRLLWLGQSTLEELAGGVDLLASREDVNPAQVLC